MTPCASATVLEDFAILRTKAKQIFLAWRSLVGLAGRTNKPASRISFYALMQCNGSFLLAGAS